MNVDPEAFLRRHHGRDVGPVTYVGAGEWSRCFGFSLDGRELVVRFGRHREDFEKDRRAAAWRSPALPVPRVLEVGPAGDGWFAVSERAHGEPLEEVAPAAFDRLMPGVVDVLDALRRIDVSEAPGWGPWGSDGSAPFPSWSAYLRSVGDDPSGTRTSGWRARLATSVVGDGPFRAGLAALGEIADVADGLAVERAVVHGDLLNRNVLVGPGRIEAVLDWGCAAYGDPLYDVAWFGFWAPWHEALAGVDLAALVPPSSGAGAGVDERLRACSLHIGLAHQGYCALLGRDDDLVRITAQTTALL